MRSATIFLLIFTSCTVAPTPAPMEPVPIPENRTGWRATLSTLAHGVSGTVTIVDNDTIRLDDFTYDGLGIAVYVYLGTADSNAAFTNGLQAGPDLYGTAYAGDSLEIDLPSGETLDDYRAVSIWCVDARVNFGSGTFDAPP